MLILHILWWYVGVFPFLFDEKSPKKKAKWLNTFFAHNLKFYFIYLFLLQIPHKIQVPNSPERMTPISVNLRCGETFHSSSSGTTFAFKKKKKNRRRNLCLFCPNLFYLWANYLFIMVLCIIIICTIIRVASCQLCYFLTVFNWPLPLYKSFCGRLRFRRIMTTFWLFS